MVLKIIVLFTLSTTPGMSYMAIVTLIMPVSRTIYRKSTSAYYYTWAENCISWKSQQQFVVALSSTKVEYIAATEAAKEVIWLSGILSEI